MKRHRQKQGLVKEAEEKLDDETWRVYISNCALKVVAITVEFMPNTNERKGNKTSRTDGVEQGRAFQDLSLLTKALSSGLFGQPLFLRRLRRLLFLLLLNLSSFRKHEGHFSLVELPVAIEVVCLEGLVDLVLGQAALGQVAHFGFGDESVVVLVVGLEGRVGFDLGVEVALDYLLQDDFA